jgi:hypothetical protein
MDRERRTRCDGCQQPVSANITLWRTREFTQGLDGRYYQQRTYCDACMPLQEAFKRAYHPVPCEWCGAPVVLAWASARRFRTFCDEHCKHSFYNHHVHLHAAAEERGNRPCPVCGRWFTASRKNVRTSSSACRQKAYRQRKALGVAPAQLVGEGVAPP